MVKLSWDDIGEKFYETGVDRGVLYITQRAGVPWNGLVNVSESPTGGEATPYYADGIKYFNETSAEEFAAAIEAFTYPDEFAECDGTVFLNGIGFGQQPRKSFSLAYRTLVGNDVDGTSHAYKIHLVYNALASPTEKPYSSINDSPEALTFNWEITTTPVYSPGVKPTSHLTIDTRKANRYWIRHLETILYGTETEDSRIPQPSEIVTLFETPTFEIQPNEATGITNLVTTDEPDIVGTSDAGFYTAAIDSRLKETSTPGLYRLE